MYQLSLVEKVLAQQVLAQGDVNVTAQSYRRLVLKGTVYHASFYEALTVRNNSIVQLRNGRFLSISRFVMVELMESGERKCIVIGDEFDLINDTLCQDRELNISSDSLVHVCRRTNRTSCVLPQNVSRKCVLIPYANSDCIVPLVNLVERD